MAGKVNPLKVKISHGPHFRYEFVRVRIGDMLGFARVLSVLLLFFAPPSYPAKKGRNSGPADGFRFPPKPHNCPCLNHTVHSFCNNTPFFLPCEVCCRVYASSNSYILSVTKKWQDEEKTNHEQHRRHCRWETLSELSRVWWLKSVFRRFIPWYDDRIGVCMLDILSILDLSCAACLESPSSRQVAFHFCAGFISWFWGLKRHTFTTWIMVKITGASSYWSVSLIPTHFFW